MLKHTALLRQLCRTQLVCSSAARAIHTPIQQRNLNQHKLENVFQYERTPVRTSTSLYVQRATYCAHIDPKFKPEVAKNVRTLRSLGATPEEVQTYLNMYNDTENRCFGVVKVGGGVVADDLDDLVESIHTLVKFGLIPVIVHGAGPQMNDTLKQLGIPSAYDEGMRITTPEILKVARKIFVETNFKLVNALEQRGCRATAIQTGVFEAKPLNMTRWGYVGEVTNVNQDPIWMALKNGCVPVLTCMGQSEDGHFLNINADVAAHDVAVTLQPRTVVFVSQKGGLLDEDGKIIQSIDINYDYDNLLSKPYFGPGDRLKLKEIKDLMTVLPRNSTVSITSAALMARELLTHSLSGTLVTNTERINVYQSLEEVDSERIIRLLEQAFNGKVEPGFLDSIKPHIDRIYLSELYHSTAIVTKVNGVPYMHKFAVAEEFQMGGLGKRLFEMLKHDYPTLTWRSRRTNPINRWYFSRADGSITKGDWIVFWYGLDSYQLIEGCVEAILQQPKDIIKSEERIKLNDQTKTSATIASKGVPPGTRNRFRIGLVGARGHTGLELIKLIEKHPALDLTVISSRSMVGKPLSALHPQTTNTELLFSDIQPEAIGDEEVDLWVMAMPNGAAKSFVDHIPDRVRVVDLSADYRFDPEWQYGLPEEGENRQKIRLSTRVANPGCYATGQQLAILPLIDNINSKKMRPILEGTPTVFGVSGYSGAGTTPSRKNDITCLRDNLMAYTLQGHIHEREVSYQLANFGFKNGVRFVPHVGQWFRGIHLTVALELDGSEGREELIYRYRNFYKDEHLVKITDNIPEVRDIDGKHHVEIGAFSVSKDNRKLVLVATIDNLLKGAATQCMQNMNLMLGLNEYASILDPSEIPESGKSTSS